MPSRTHTPFPSPTLFRPYSDRVHVQLPPYRIDHPSANIHRIADRLLLAVQVRKWDGSIPISDCDLAGGFDFVKPALAISGSRGGNSNGGCQKNCRFFHHFVSLRGSPMPPLLSNSHR